MIENDLISIIVPIYNVEKYINKCVDSIINQTYKNLEIILVDDGSPDNCPQICDEYAKKDNRIKIIHKENGGLSSARNAGLDIMTGKYVTFIDSDDYYEPEAIEILYNCIKDSKVQISVMKFLKVYETDSINKKTNNINTVQYINSIDYLKFLCEKKISESVWDKLFDIEILKNKRFEIGRLNEDFIFLSKLLILNNVKISLIDFYGYNYYSRANSITSNGYGKSLIDSVKNGFELLELAKKEKPETELYFARFILYQIRTIFIIMPWDLIKNNNEVFINLLTDLKQTIKYIDKTNLSVIDKMFLKSANILPKLTIFLFKILYIIKNKLKKRIK